MKSRSRFANIPRELRRLNQWVGSENGVPKNPRFPGRKARTNDPTTWGSFEEAVAGVEAGHYDGVSFVFTEDDSYVGIDLDACRDPETGEIADWAMKIVEDLDTYTEISRSGTGLHIVLKIEDEA